MLVSWKQWLLRTRHSALIWQFRNTDTFRFVQALEEERGRKTVVHRYLFSNYAFGMAINKHQPKNGDWTSVLNLSFGLQMDVVVHWESQDPKHCLPCHLKLLRVSPSASSCHGSIQHWAIEVFWASKMSERFVCEQLSWNLSVGSSLSTHARLILQPWVHGVSGPFSLTLCSS